MSEQPTPFYDKCSAHIEAAHDGALVPTCETCLTLLDQVLRERNTTPFDILSANEQDANSNPRIKACMEVLAERWLKTPNAKEIMRVAAEAVTHSNDAHGHSGIVKECETCMYYASKLMELTGVEPERVVNKPIPSDPTNKVVQGVIEYRKQGAVDPWA